MKELWRKIPFNPMYEVSNIGRVASLYNVRRKLISLFKRNDGHIQASLFKKGKLATKSVHRLVLFAFVGLPPDGMECCHIDGNPANNSLENLRWDTRKNNHLDRIGHGTIPYGEKSNLAKLNTTKVLSIRRRFKKKESAKDLAKEFKVHSRTIYDIAKRKTWSHI